MGLTGSFLVVQNKLCCTAICTTCEVMTKRLVLALFVRLTLVHTAELALAGTNNAVVYGSGNDEVRLTATCSSSATPSWTSVMPQVVDVPTLDSLGNLTVWLKDVPVSCINAALSTPCASHRAGLPALFKCHFSGSGGEETTGPFRAQTEEFLTSTGSLLGIETFLDCTPRHSPQHALPPPTPKLSAHHSRLTNTLH